MSPKKNRRLVALQRHGAWIEVYRGELLLAHPAYRFKLENMGLEECDTLEVYDNPEDAEIGNDKYIEVKL